MFSPFIFYFLSFVFLCGLLFLLYQIFVFSKTRVPYMATPKKRYPIIFKHITIRPETIIYDLGCGKGDFLFEAEKRGAKKLLGYELSPLHALWGQIYAKIKKSNVQIFKKDYFQADISSADIIYLFLTPPAAAKLVPKLLKEARSGATIISLGAPIEKLPNSRIIETDPHRRGVRIYIYKIIKT